MAISMFNRTCTEEITGDGTNYADAADAGESAKKMTKLERQTMTVQLLMLLVLLSSRVLRRLTR